MDYSVASCSSYSTGSGRFDYLLPVEYNEEVDCAWRISGRELFFVAIAFVIGESFLRLVTRETEAFQGKMGNAHSSLLCDLWHILLGATWTTELSNRKGL